MVLINIKFQLPDDDWNSLIYFLQSRMLLTGGHWGFKLSKHENKSEKLF